MKWSELSITEKNEVIKMAVAQGIKDIPSIKNLYEESVNGSRRFDDGGLFGNETVDTVASFLPIVGTAEDAYTFYQNPTLANAGWLALSLGSDVLTGGLASRAIKAMRAANKAVDAANAARRAAAKEYRAAKAINGANHTKESGTRIRHAITAAGAVGDTRNAAIKRANNALFEAGIGVGVDQGVNNFLNAAQMDVLPDLSKYADGGSIHIAPSKKGTFTAAASKHGMGVQEFASKVLAHPENYSLTMRKKANFARNASHWKH